jgi:HlyD family type I secretion membrane fusion protein
MTSAAAGEQDVDTGLLCLVLMLRYTGVPADPAQLRHGFDDAARKIPATRRLLRPIKSRVVASSRGCLSQSPRTAIAAQKEGGFFVAAKSAEARALIQAPIEYRPVSISRAEREAAWDGIAPLAHLSEAESLIASIQRKKAQGDEELKRDRLKELADAEMQASAIDQELTKADERQRLKTIVAPASGTVQQLAVHTVGGMIQPGQALMAIVPDDSGIEIEAMILNQDIGFVAEGQEAVIKLDAFPFTRYGIVPGKIKIVSEDAVDGGGSQQGGLPSEARSAQEGSSNPLFYTARVTFDQTTMNVDGKAVKLAPGMAATVEIKTGKRKLIEFLLSPLMKMTDEAGRER